MTLSNSAFRFVLVRTSHPGNIGSAARAIRTMGFTSLALVNPARFPAKEATTMAVGAPGVLDHAPVFHTMAEALDQCHFIVGLSARRRGINLPELMPREAAAQARSAHMEGKRVAFVFGNESSGLDNAELLHCHAMVRIPSVADFSSLNLAQAVQVMAYELRLAMGDRVEALPPATVNTLPANGAQMEQFFLHLEETLDSIDFHKGRSPKTVMLRLRKLFQRALPDERELRILHGILSDAERMARLASIQKSS